jgi:hypothetical protein
MDIAQGIYRHYKGKDYLVYGVATHSETEEKLVVYRSLYGEYRLTVRPLTMFLENVNWEGERVARFSLIQAFKDS